MFIPTSLFSLYISYSLSLPLSLWVFFIYLICYFCLFMFLHFRTNTYSNIDNNTYTST